MEIKKHFKMYKSGKQWCVAALATLAITTGGILSTSTAHADITSAVPSSAVEAVSTNLSANNEAVSASSSANSEAADVSSSSTSSASSSQGSASAEKATTVNVATGTNTSASSAAATAESSNTSSSATTTNDDSQPIREVKAAVSNTTNARFETKDGKVYYYDAENHMYQNQWYENWGNKYYFGDDGARITSATHDIDGATYYFDNQGIMKSNYFLNQGGKVYYFDKDGKEYKNRFYSNWGNKYYFGADGVRITSATHDIDGATYYFDDQGIMKSDYFLNRDGKVYYFGKDGKEYKDQFYSNWGNMYYFGKDGARYTNQYYFNWGHTYYFGEGGVRYTSRFYSNDGKLYYFDKKGIRLTNQWYQNWGNKYYFGADGARITSTTHDIDGATYYFDNQGIMKSDYFLNQDGKVYYFDKDGKEYKDQFYSNWGNMYYFGKDGARYTNQYYSNWGHTYYFGEGGVRYTDRFYSNDGKLYYFDKKGIRLTNQWYQNWGNKYYFGADGARITSTTHDIDGATYYFDNQGIMKSDYFLNQGGEVYYFGKDGKEYKNQFYSNWGNMYYFGKDGARYTNRFYQNWGHTYYFGDGGVLLKNQTKQIDGITLTFDKDGIITNTSSVTSVIREQIAKEVAQKLNSDIKWDWTNQSNGYQELALHDLAQLLAQGDANNDGAALAKRLQSDSLLSGEVLSSTVKRLNGTPANIAEAFVSQLNATSDQKNGAVVGVGFDLANDQVAIILFKPANEQAVAQVSSSIIAKIAEVYKAAGINSNVEVANGLTTGTTVSASELGSAWQQLNTALLKGTANETIPSDVLQAIFNDLPGNKTALNGTKTYTTANGDQYHYEYWLAGQSADDKLQNFLKENQGAKYGDQLKVNYTATLTWGPASQVTTDTTPASQKTDSQLDLAYQTGSETGARYDKVTVEKLPGMTEDMIRGVDISSYQALVNAGVQFYDFNGNKAPLFKVLKDAGVNWVRIRVWNDPYDKDGNGYGGGNNDEATLVKLATEASQYGLKVLVDFHYSDFWADPAKQPLPKAWKNLSSNDLNQSIYLYTAKVLTDLRNAGANVGMVQVGNEITNGVFGLYSDRDHGGNWRSLWQGKDANQVAQYLATGTSAVRAILPTAKIALQLETPNIDKYRTIMTVWKNNHVDYDYLGTSYYPFWSTGDNNGTYNGQNLGTGANTPNNLKAIEEMAQNEFGKQVVVLETAWVSTTQDSDGTGNSIGSTSDTSAYPVNPQGQVNALEDMYKALIAGNGVGGFYWEPAWIPVKAGWDNWQFNKEMSNLYGTGWASKYAIGYAPDNVMYYNGQPTWGGTTWDNAALFDDHGHPLQSLMAYAGMLNGYTTPTIEQTSSVNAKVTQIVNKTDVTPNDGLTTNAAPSITNLISEDGQKLLKGDPNQTISKSVLEQIAKDLITSSKSQIYTADSGATYHYVYTLDGATADEQVANFVKANANAKYGNQLVADYTATVVIDQEATPLVPTAGEATSPIVVKVGQVWNTVGNGTVNVTNGPKSGDVLTSNDLNLQGISTTAVQKLLTGKKGEAISADALNQVKSLLTNKAVEGTKTYTVDGNNYHYEYWLQSVDQNGTYGSPVTLTYSASLKWDGKTA